MNSKIVTIVLCASFVLCNTTSSAQIKSNLSEYAASIQEERDEKNTEFKDKEESILEEKDRKRFKGLEYYGIDENYKVQAAFELIEDGEVFEMKTSTDRLPLYKRYATLTFTLKGDEFTLTAYQNQKLKEDDEYKDYLFIPFTDLTNGESTYGGGRYIDIRIPDSNEIDLDFNTCYNPYCAYNYKYSCPIPPMENHLRTKIKAGVKKFKEK